MTSHPSTPVPEILAPAGNLTKLKVACLYGADAVYIGGQKFGLRTAADNFTRAEICEGVHFARKTNTLVYVTLNSFPFDSDLETLPEYGQFLEQSGVHAVIVSDLGAVQALQKATRLPIHLSTQSSCVNAQAGKFWRDQGVQRLILGRECSLEEATIIRQQTGLEVEVFIHGSMCMAWSGHCVISNYTEGRDANRGGCNYACRFSYTHLSDKSSPVTRTFFSSKDLNGMPVLQEALDSGLDSLKIEGRMKSPLYVATCIRVYREALKLLHQGQSVDGLHQELQKLPHRGYTTGSLAQPAGPDSVNLLSPDTQPATSHRYAGIIGEPLEDGRLVLDIKAPIETSMTLEFLPFEGPPIPLPANRLTTLEGKQKSVLHPNSLALMPAHSGLRPYQVFRCSTSEAPL